MIIKTENLNFLRLVEDNIVICGYVSKKNQNSIIFAIEIDRATGKVVNRVSVDDTPCHKLASANLDFQNRFRTFYFGKR